jgi:hypothetical protein
MGVKILAAEINRSVNFIANGKNARSRKPQSKNRKSRMNMPSLVGMERARIEDFNWATATFSWAIKELRVTQTMVASDPDNQKLRIALINHEEAIW